MDSTLILILMFAVIFLFMILPQQRRAKAQRKFLEELGKGDEIVTNGGIIGKITQVDEGGSYVTLTIDGKSSMRVMKSAISKEMTETFAKDA